MARTFPPGKYWIGDLCYVLQDTWEEVNGMYKVSVNDKTGKARELGMDSTACGDGGYVGSNGFCYGVDSGSIGIAPKEIIEKFNGLFLGTCHRFSSDVSFNCDDTGVFTITCEDFVLKIDTSGEAQLVYDEKEECDYDWEDWDILDDTSDESDEKEECDYDWEDRNDTRDVKSDESGGLRTLHASDESDGEETVLTERDRLLAEHDRLLAERDRLLAELECLSIP